jgi:hypothetical protein
MRTARSLIAVLLGVVIYNIAVVYAGGFFAALGIPKSYFAFFGREWRGLALMLMFVGAWALPVMALVVASTFVSLRLLRHDFQTLASCLVIGMLMAFLYWQLSGAFYVSPDASSTTPSPWSVFFSTLVPAWWSLPNALAPWIGVALGIFVAKRAAHVREQSDA